MPKKQSDLSITKRVLLSYIKFRTRNNFNFYESNDYIARALDIMASSAKVFVNELIGDGYLYKEIDKKGRRVLSLTGKEYRPLFEDMNNIDKKVLKEDRDNYERDNQYLNEQLTYETACNETLLHENTKLVLSNSELTQRVQNLEEELAALKKRVSSLENIFYQNGVSPEKLEELIKQSTQ